MISLPQVSVASDLLLKAFAIALFDLLFVLLNPVVFVRHSVRLKSKKALLLDQSLAFSPLCFYFPGQLELSSEFRYLAPSFLFILVSLLFVMFQRKVPGALKFLL